MTTRTPRTRLTDPFSEVRDLTGTRAIVTGGAGGIGVVTTRMLAASGADVIVGTRGTERAEKVRDGLLAELDVPRDRIRIVHLDLIDPDSIHRFVDRVGDGPVHTLVLNAAMSNVPFQRDRSGTESQFATNHLGHFALTGRLLPALLAAPEARIVTVSSALYTSATLDLARLDDPAGYSPGRAYIRSKLANTMFATDLNRRLAAADSTARSFGAHPGMARTPLHATYPSAVTRAVTATLARVIGRDPEPAAVGILAAALSTQATPELFWGPAGSKRHPDALGSPYASPATDHASAAALWSRSEDLTGLAYLSEAVPSGTRAGHEA
ncbi:NAD(P)-dependent dehydrogenase (short-subunit alcohol dehydrogenase family) [Agromyces sp. 3263]|uniref:SDR family NAD(P)-dependent oxidoreductase n=1 Tax=Agromyces sp. 3263 TaxID=2817750 RepID=UPI0028620023|nr:SDR family NAD(P)-dependent oxidoreductase [Agromyces sp. 3263]MDR6906063.1 NAD(P)-dependent dehydrogenase (short-subunit alcohol dehydrogenase family) [Agromyces sp. 3263]